MLKLKSRANDVFFYEATDDTKVHLEKYKK